MHFNSYSNETLDLNLLSKSDLQGGIEKIDDIALPLNLLSLQFQVLYNCAVTQNRRLYIPDRRPGKPLLAKCTSCPNETLDLDFLSKSDLQGGIGKIVGIALPLNLLFLQFHII